jgi:hypothetical protein
LREVEAPTLLRQTTNRWRQGSQPYAPAALHPQVTHLSWSLFNFNRSFVILAEGPDISPFASLIPVVDSQYVLWFL